MLGVVRANTFHPAAARFGTWKLLGSATDIPVAQDLAVPVYCGRCHTAGA